MIGDGDLMTEPRQSPGRSGSAGTTWPDARAAGEQIESERWTIDRALASLAMRNWSLKISAEQSIEAGGGERIHKS